MIVLAAADFIAGQTLSNTNSITMTVEGMELAANVETYKTLAQAQLSTSVVAVYTVPASTQAFIKSIHLANTTATAVPDVRLFTSGSAAGNRITGSFTIPANGWAVYEDGGWTVYNANGRAV